MSRLEQGVHIVVGTPGRVFDMINRRALFTDSIKLLVLEEADEMLSRGFKDQIYDMFRFMPPKCQVGLFSATMPQEVLEIANKFMRDPVQILVKRKELTLEGVKQFYVMVDREEWKLDTLCDLIETVPVTSCVIFVNSRRKVDWLAENMTLNNFNVLCIHGEMEQKERDIVMREFRPLGLTLPQCNWLAGPVLITTDLCDLYDIGQYSLTINYDVPIADQHHYLRRVGRIKCRFGRDTVAITFLTEDDRRVMLELEQLHNTRVEELPMNFADWI